MVLVHRKIDWLAVDFSAGGVEHYGPGLSFSARFQNVQCSLLICLPAFEWVFLSPCNPRDGCKMKHRVLTVDDLADGIVVEYVATDLGRAQEARVGVEL